MARTPKSAENPPLNNPVIDQISGPYGETYVVRCSLGTPDGRNPCIITVWIVQKSDPNPRLVTAYAHQP